MKIKLFISVLLCVILFTFGLTGTIESQNKKRDLRNLSSLKLVADKPSVFITFEKSDKRTPLRENESSNGIWLRLHNNFSYSISFCAFGISNGEQMSFYGKNTELGLNYEVELTNPSKFSGTNEDVPVGYLVGGICHKYELKSGKSLLFAVPAEHLVKGLSIKMPFSYEWEEESENNPTHFVYFNSANIPKK